MMKIVVLADANKKNVVAALDEHADWLRSHAEVIAVILKPEADLSDLKADLAVIFGGDGFILGVVRRMGNNQIPIVGINFGKLGFLAGVQSTSIREALSEVLAGTPRVSERMTLSVCLYRDGERAFCSIAVNDVVIASRGVRMVQTELFIGDNLISCFVGDGLVVATPTGSTAHSLAAGGPLVEPTIDAILITPLSPHSLTARPLAVDASHVMEVRLTPDYDQASLIVDGQKRVDMSSEHRLTIERAPSRFKLVEPKNLGYFDILKTKLNWGSHANYGV